MIESTRVAPVTSPHILIVATGAEVAPLKTVKADVVICADGGVGAARRAGLVVDLVVGDLDSAESEPLAEAAESGAKVHGHPVDKDQSDLELALSAAMAMGPSRISVHLAAGGRLDHQFANLVVLASPAWSAVPVDALVGNDPVWVIRTRRRLDLRVGDPLALHPVGGEARGVTTEGLAWKLDNAVLDPFSARGIANRVTGSAAVSVADGVVLAISSSD